MKHLLTPMIFMSAYRADMPIEMNVQRHAQLVKDLESVHKRFLSVVGSYAGKMEQSVALSITDGILRTPASTMESVYIQGWIRLAARYGQESVLVRHADGSCYLIYCEDGREEYIGQWREVSADAALDSGAWSRINGRYFKAV